MGLPPEAVVALLTRAPSSGGKSRLFAELGRPGDPALLTAMLLDTLDGVVASGHRCIVFVEPAAACDEVRGLVPSGVEVRGQQQGTIGDRMRSAMADVLAAGASQVIVVGSDLPDLDARMITDAACALDTDPDTLVLGPTGDGGYYLIAARRVPDVFDGIEWSGARVLAQTRAAAVTSGLRVHLLGLLNDVDDVGSLRRVRAWRTAGWVAQTIGM